MLGRTVRVMGVLTAWVYLATSAFADQATAPKEALSIPAGSVLHMKLTTRLPPRPISQGTHLRVRSPRRSLWTAKRWFRNTARSKDMSPS